LAFEDMTQFFVTGFFYWVLCNWDYYETIFKVLTFCQFRQWVLYIYFWVKHHFTI
jgi:hypothetical protein